MVAVPAETPDTTPLLLTVATKLLFELHAPPEVPLLLKVIGDPAQTVDGPLIVPALANGLTVTLNEEEELPHVLDTV